MTPGCCASASFSWSSVLSSSASSCSPAGMLRGRRSVSKALLPMIPTLGLSLVVVVFSFVGSPSVWSRRHCRTVFSSIFVRQSTFISVCYPAWQLLPQPTHTFVAQFSPYTPHDSVCWFFNCLLCTKLIQFTQSTRHVQLHFIIYRPSCLPRRGGASPCERRVLSS